MSDDRKKKFFIEFPNVTHFMATQSAGINAEYREIVQNLETNGRLAMPFGEKLKGKDLFVIRVINAGNVRVFYVYGKGDNVYGIHGYEKKSQHVPRQELRHAQQFVKALREAGLL